MKPSRASLEAILRRCRIDLSSEQVDQLWRYHGLLREADARLNLTRIHQFDNMVLKHYVDSLLVLQHVPELPSPLVDMGSGPGLPGIPLKIARPEVEMILAEPRGARAEFLREVCAALSLEKVEVYAGKVGSQFPYEAGGVITRAVATIPETLDRVARCMAAGGRMLFMKGPDCDAEIEEAAQSHRRLFRFIADHGYTIPGTSHHRRLVVYERTEAEAPLDPRGESVAPAYNGPVREIASATNAMFKLWRDLLNGRGIRKQGQALVSGAKPVAEILARFPGRVAAWLTGPDGPPPPPESAAHPAWYRLAPPLFEELDTFGTHSPLLLVSVPELPDWSPADPWPLGCTLFVPFQDPENVGAVLRTAAAFDVARVVLTRETAHPFHPKATRAAGPAVFQVPMLRGPSLAEIQSGEIPLIALTADAPALVSEPLPERFGLVAGVEGPGLPEILRAGSTRRIPIAPGVESLNAAAATAIALYEWRKQSPA